MLQLGKVLRKGVRMPEQRQGGRRHLRGLSRMQLRVLRRWEMRRRRRVQGGYGAVADRAGCKRRAYRLRRVGDALCALLHEEKVALIYGNKLYKHRMDYK